MVFGHFVVFSFGDCIAFWGSGIGVLMILGLVVAAEALRKRKKMLSKSETVKLVSAEGFQCTSLCKNSITCTVPAHC